MKSKTFSCHVFKERLGMSRESVAFDEGIIQGLSPVGACKRMSVKATTVALMVNSL